MSRWQQIIVELLRWSACLVAAGALAFFSLNSLLGLAGVGLLPAAAIGAWLAIATVDSQKRTWWLGWAATFGAAIPTCPFWNGAIPAAAWWLSQRLTSIPWDYLEFASLLLSPVLPVLVVGSLGIAVGAFTRYVFRTSVARHDPAPSNELKWRFSLRQLMVTIAVFGLVLGWNMEWMRRGQSARRENQLAFLQRFKTSFSSGQMELLAEPTLEGLHRSVKAETGYRVFQTPGISEYRISAPIREAGQEKWAVWSYTCGPDNVSPGGGEFVFQFAYAEAADEAQLPKFPFPPKRYIQYSSDIIDGLPSTAGPIATIVSSPLSASVDQPVVVKATAPRGTTCRLVVWPAEAVVAPVPDQTPNTKGTVEWSVMIRPQYAGGSIGIEVQCIEPRGPRKALMNTTPASNVRLLPAGSAR
jgi:hypothetical protein